MSEYGAFRFGRDTPARIATTTQMLVEPFAVLPGEPMYQPIPFYPSLVSGSGGQLGASTTADTEVWNRYPGRCDLTWYQGDDVQIPLFIEDPSDLTPDMATAWDWSAQIRVIHSYHSTLLNTFSIVDEYTPPVGLTPGFTKVTLFLPRSENCYVGKYRWDLYSKSPLNGIAFPRPPDVPEPEPWPPIDQIRTWLYGVVTIIPRVTSTDFLPAIPEISEGGGGGTLMYGGFFAGPNGRVP